MLSRPRFNFVCACDVFPFVDFCLVAAKSRKTADPAAVFLSEIFLRRCVKIFQELL